MPFAVTTSRARKGGSTFLLFELSQDGMVVTVRAGGRCRVPGFEEQTLGEDVEFQATAHPTAIVYVIGWVVKVKETGMLDVFVDEVGGDFGNDSYAFNSESPYERLMLLYHFQLPPAATSLDDVTIHVYQTLEDEE